MSLSRRHSPLTRPPHLLRALQASSLHERARQQLQGITARQGQACSQPVPERQLQLWGLLQAKWEQVVALQQAQPVPSTPDLQGPPGQPMKVRRQASMTVSVLAANRSLCCR